MNNSNILRDPLTPQNRDNINMVSNIAISKKVSHISNIANDEQGKLNHMIKTNMLVSDNQSNQKQINRLRVQATNKIAAIKSRQNIQLKNINNSLIKSNSKIINNESQIINTVPNTVIKESDKKLR